VAFRASPSATSSIRPIVSQRRLGNCTRQERIPVGPTRSTTPGHRSACRGFVCDLPGSGHYAGDNAYAVRRKEAEGMARSTPPRKTRPQNKPVPPDDPEFEVFRRLLDGRRQPTKRVADRDATRIDRSISASYEWPEWLLLLRDALPNLPSEHR